LVGDLGADATCGAGAGLVGAAVTLAAAGVDGADLGEFTLLNTGATALG
jgi:hypothetical protein